jgi:uncharacterized membrane protein YccC
MPREPGPSRPLWHATSRRSLAFGRALRTAIVVMIAFSVGRWALHDVTIAVFATFTGLALTGIADFGGTYSGRVGAIAASVISGIGLTALGTRISDDRTWVVCASMFVVAGVVALAGLLGGYAAAASNALILFYVVAAGTPAHPSAIAARVAGVGFGGVIALVASVGLWPAAPRPLALRRLGDATLLMASRLRVLASGMASPRRDATVTNVRATVEALADRPASPTRPQRAELYLVNDLERLDGLVARLEVDPTTGMQQRAALASAAATLSACGAALSGDAPVVDRPAPAPQIADLSLVARLNGVTSAIDTHTRAALGMPLGSILDAFSLEDGRAGRSDFGHGLRRVRASLTWRSVHARDALRLGVGLALATGIAHAFSLQHGFWVAFATLTVIKSNVRATGRSVGQAVLGTVVGFAVATLVITVFGSNVFAYALLLPVTVTMAIYANVAVNFVLGQAGFTVVIVVLFNILGPAGWRVGVVRVEDVVAGGIAGLLIGALAWPRGASAEIGPASSELVRSSMEYLALTVRRAVTGGLQGDPSVARRAAMSAAARAEDTYAQLLAERPAEDEGQDWAGVMALGNRLWYVADLLRAAGTRAQQEPRRVLAALERLSARCAVLVASLQGRHSPVLGPRSDASDVPGSPDGTLLAWLEELAADVPVARVAQ